jgi:hypothetical protein
MLKLLALIANPVHSALLRSPLHTLVSHRMILLTFYGRKSGRKYTIPVYYVRVGQEVRFFTDRSRSWRLNLTRGTWVKVCVRGVRYDGIVEQVPASHARMVQALCAFDSALSSEEAERIADHKVMFQISLQAETSHIRGCVPGIG